MRIIKVTWNDAWQGGFEEFTRKQVRKAHGAFVQTSVGYEAAADKTGITLAGCVDEDGAFHRVLFIPRGMVKTVTVLANG
jgi:hypothetical protein